MVDRISGALHGVAIGDALGATLEFMDRSAVALAFPDGHREIIGGGHFEWRPGQGTDDTDLTFVVIDAIEQAEALDHAVRAAADGMLAWLDADPPDVGGATAASLGRYRTRRDPTSSGAGEGARGNGSLMRTLPIGLARSDPDRRRAEAAAISRITHDDRECVDACIVHCELASALLEGCSPTEAVGRATIESSVAAVADAVGRGAARSLGDAIAAGQVPEVHGNAGYVLDSLSIAVAALVDPRPAAEILIDVVNLGGDADTTGVIAGGLLGVRDGMAAWPTRWVEVLEYRPRLDPAAIMLAARRMGGTQ